MALTWTVPQSGDPFGPGFFVQAISDVSGPFPGDTFWEIELTAPANENIVATMTVPYQSNLIGTVFWNGTLTQVAPIHIFPWVVSGQSGQVRISLVEPGIGVADTGVQPIVMDTQSGQLEELKNWIRLQPFAAGQGLTAEEHDSLIITEQAVTSSIGPNVGDLVQGLSQLITRPPISFGSLSSPPYTLTGDGEMPDIADALHSKFGIYWTADIPTGFGHEHGATEEYRNRLVQFRTVHHVASQDMVTETFDAHFHGGLWLWELTKPLRIDYSVTPGVTIHAQWWQWP